MKQVNSSLDNGAGLSFYFKYASIKDTIFRRVSNKKNTMNIHQKLNFRL